jgi:hypothetical protein
LRGGLFVLSAARRGERGLQSLDLTTVLDMGLE